MNANKREGGQEEVEGEEGGEPLMDTKTHE